MSAALRSGIGLTIFWKTDTDWRQNHPDKDEILKRRDRPRIARTNDPQIQASLSWMNEHFKGKGCVFLILITPDNLMEFRHTWKMSPRTASKHMERMKTFFKFAMEFGWIKSSPAKPIAVPKGEESESVPFPEEHGEILVAGSDSYDGDGQRVKALSLLLLWSSLWIGHASTI